MEEDVQSEEIDVPLSVLVVDDDQSLRESLAVSLSHAGYSVQTADCASAAISQLQSEPLDIILCDLKMPDTTDLNLIQRCRELAPTSVVILMSAYGNHELAVEALRNGAYDYLSKPFPFEELLLSLKKIEQHERLRAENVELKSAISRKYSFANIVAQSKCMQEIFGTVKRLASFSTTVLLTGESGTGKELLARALHHNSPRRGKAFIAINCGAIPENLMESELFGHKRGAFTDATRDKRGLLEEAHGGTVFLDEIGEMPLHLQVKLLRALQEQKIRRVGDEQMLHIDVRVIAATLRDLEQDVKSGRFRDDLYYRLNVVSIHIPPLRERSEDVPVLIQHFIRKHAKRLGLAIPQVSGEAMKCMLEYHWKGNVRELENCIERALVLSESGLVDLESLPEAVRAGVKSATQCDQAEFSDNDLSIKKHTRALELKLIQRALQRTKGNRTHAAKILEISHRALLYKLKEYGVSK